MYEAEDDCLYNVESGEKVLTLKEEQELNEQKAKEA